MQEKGILLNPHFLSLQYQDAGEAKSTEAFLREEVFGKKQTTIPQQLGISGDKVKALKQADVVANRYKQGVNQSASPLSLKLEFNNYGKLVNKLESSAFGFKEYKYDFDSTGHLLNVWCNDKLQEQYYYNELGQRIKSVTPRLSSEYSYNNLGQLVYSNAVSYEYDSLGRLISKQYKGKKTTFEYKNPRYHTLLTKIVLENSDSIQYLYDGIMPVAKYLNAILTERYIWKHPYQLLKWQDCIHNKEYQFEYADKRSPVAVYTNNQRYALGCDQVGSVKIVLDYMGNLIKYIDYDSFGNILADNNKAFFIPLAFAGGLLDKDTGLLHFGYRAYDSKLGRFIAPDPLGDTGGDHDLYDYCVDDPVSANDFSGLQGQRVWNENDHPRDEIGRFTFKDASGIDIGKVLTEINKGNQEQNNKSMVFKPKEKNIALINEKATFDNYRSERYKSELGVFENGETAFYQGGVSKIFEATSEAPNSGARILYGSFKPGRGIGGTMLSYADEEGKLRLTVYGNDKTKEASRWALFRWSKTGKTLIGNPDIDIHDWERVTDFREVEYTHEFQNLYRQFNLFKKQ